jgi:hypothetical protein
VGGGVGHVDFSSANNYITMGGGDPNSEGLAMLSGIASFQNHQDQLRRRKIFIIFFCRFSL